MTDYGCLDQYLLSMPGAEKDFKEEWGWERYMIRGKLFAAFVRDMDPPLLTLKLEPAKVEEVCAAAQNFVTAVNYNSPVQTVIAGTPEGIEEVTPIFKEMKGRVIPLNVAGAFHSKLMQPAADLFYETAKTINFSAPDKKYYSNVTGGELTDFSDMASMLAKHIVSPVRFTSELAAMQADGADTFVEFGPGKVLTGLVKKTLSDVTAKNVSDCNTLESL